MKLFHITYERNLPGIAQDGLVPGHTSLYPSGLHHHLRGAIFLTSPDGVFFWYTNSEEAMIHVSDDPQADGYTPVVLRVPEPEHGCAYDELGTDDANAPAFRCVTSIPASKIELWDGEHWLPISQYQRLDTSSSYDEDGYFSGDYPLLPEWRDMQKKATAKRDQHAKRSSPRRVNRSAALRRMMKL